MVEIALKSPHNSAIAVGSRIVGVQTDRGGIVGDRALTLVELEPPPLCAKPVSARLTI